MAGNPSLAKNFGRLSKSQMSSRRRTIPKKGTSTKPSDGPPVTTKARGGFYNGDASLRRKIARKPAGTARLRSSITPGTVVIILAGRFRGKRVIVLKQLASGLLLVTGPFKLNGVPLRRVNQAYVIATSTKVDVSSVTVDDKLNDSYFVKDPKKRSKGSEKEFFEKDGKDKEKKTFPSDKAEDQKSLDKALIKEIEKTENLSKYLGSTFGLSKGQFPHLLKF